MRSFKLPPDAEQLKQSRKFDENWATNTVNSSG